MNDPIEIGVEYRMRSDKAALDLDPRRRWAGHKVVVTGHSGLVNSVPGTHFCVRFLTGNPEESHNSFNRWWLVPIPALEQLAEAAE